MNTTKEDVPKIEGMSEKIHHLYCGQYLKDQGEPYWTNGDYSKLTEQSKEYDRNIARFIFTLQAELIAKTNELFQEVEDREDRVERSDVEAIINSVF